jgi:hypothetical protein
MKGRATISEAEALAPGAFIDSDAPSIVAIARTHQGATSIETARALYDFTRDAIRYDPYVDYTDPKTYRASAVLEAGFGYCVGKAALFAALCRAAGLPAVLGLADVCNHLATPELLERVGTNVFHYHGFVLVKPAQSWLKVSPTFNASLCQKLGVGVLAFDGRSDALLQPHDDRGRQFMAYLTEHGLWQDVPFKPLLAEMKRLYPRLTMQGGLRGASMDREALSHAPK